MSLVGRLALVTGAGSGIGKAICRLFAEERAAVIAADINSKATTNTVAMLPAEKERKHYAVKVDVALKKSIDDMAEKVIEKYQRAPSVIVNCAGIGAESGDIFEVTEEMFGRITDVNWKGTFFICQKFMSLMKKEGISGSIVNVSSVNSGGEPFCPVYSASKAAVDVFTKAQAKQAAELGIRINSIRPGIVDTPMGRGIPKELDEIVLRETPQGRMADPREIAELCVFLASDKSSFITGASYLISGGFQR